MLKVLKSPYILKIIFSYIDEQRKLEYIKYNKFFQKKLFISITNYNNKKFNAIYDKNNKGKEYNGRNDILIFEGEYLNGKRLGKGKEYWDNKLIFKGEYLNGKRNGKGRKYLSNDKLEFEGDYLNNKRNGTGKEYNLVGNLEYIGEYLNNKRHGKGKEYYNNGNLKFKG